MDPWVVVLSVLSNGSQGYGLCAARRERWARTEPVYTGGHGILLGERQQLRGHREITMATIGACEAACAALGQADGCEGYAYQTSTTLCWLSGPGMSTNLPAGWTARPYASTAIVSAQGTPGDCQCFAAANLRPVRTRHQPVPTGARSSVEQHGARGHHTGTATACDHDRDRTV